jgi:hypothetical protein
MTGAMMVNMSHRIVPAVAPSGATLIYDFDAANFSAVPTNGNLVSGYTLSVTNAGSISYVSANGGYFSKNNSVGTDTIIGGPNYTSTSQSYTVFMAYQVNSIAGGRLLNTANEATNDWLMGSYYNGSYFKNVFYPAATVNLSSDTYTGDSGWNFVWGSYNAVSGNANVYIASSSVNNVSGPSTFYKQLTGQSGAHGFNQLRLWSRSAASETQTGNVGFIKVYNGDCTISQIQSMWSTYHTRFGI